MLFSSAVTAAVTSIATSIARRHGVISVNTAKIQTPLLKRGADLFLDAGDYLVGFAERQGVDVNGYLGKKSK